MAKSRLLLGGMLLLAATTTLADSPLSFENAWSPVAPPGRMMAGYADIHNRSDHSVSLVGGSSPQFERVEIHTVAMDDGVMRMRRVDEFTVEAGDSASLEPGGTHLMLIAPRQRLEVGDTIEIELNDTEGRSYSMTAEVRERTP